MKINNEKLMNPKTRLKKGDYLIQIGKKKHFKLKISWFVYPNLLQ